MTEPFDAKQHVQELLDRGWQWSRSHPDVLLHPENHELRVRYNRVANTLSISPELERRLDLVILTPAGKSRVFRR